MMSLEQYKDANRRELWEILQVQAEYIAELEAMLAHWKRTSHVEMKNTALKQVK